MPDSEKLGRFERAILPHLAPAHNLARWLIRNEHDAEDLVQQACLRALTYFDGFRGEDGRSWLLSIVRNTCYTWLEKSRSPDVLTSFDEADHSAANDATPETLQLRKCDTAAIRRALEDLPVALRETLVLRELEELSYRQIARITAVPVGTVMSRLARARERLRRALGVAGKAGALT